MVSVGNNRVGKILGNEYGVFNDSEGLFPVGIRLNRLRTHDDREDSFRVLDLPISALDFHSFIGVEISQRRHPAGNRGELTAV